MDKLKRYRHGARNGVMTPDPEGPFVRYEDVAAALEAAREDACMALVADIRLACGDNGKRMQPELVEFIRELAKDAAKYRWGINNSRWIRGEQEAYVAIPVARGADLSCVAMIDAAIDQARGKGVQDEA